MDPLCGVDYFAHVGYIPAQHQRVYPLVDHLLSPSKLPLLALYGLRSS